VFNYNTSLWFLSVCSIGRCVTHRLLLQNDSGSVLHDAPVARKLLADRIGTETSGTVGGEAGLARVDHAFTGSASGRIGVGDSRAVLSDRLTWEGESTSTACSVSFESEVAYPTGLTRFEINSGLDALEGVLVVWHALGVGRDHAGFETDGASASKTTCGETSSLGHT
jgi:hypothetical protein